MAIPRCVSTPRPLPLRTRQFNHSMDTDTAACRRSVVSRRVLMAPYYRGNAHRVAARLRGAWKP